MIDDIQLTKEEALLIIFVTISALYKAFDLIKDERKKQLDKEAPPQR